MAEQQPISPIFRHTIAKPRNSMNPSERTLWLAKHGAPPNMRLITDLELHVIGQGLNAERAKAQALEMEVRGCARVLGDYWNTQPDLINACDAAVFDAKRFNQAIEHAEAALNDAQQLFMLIATSEVERPTAILVSDIVGTIQKLDNVLGIIKKQREQRRPTLKSNPPGSAQ